MDPAEIRSTEDNKNSMNTKTRRGVLLNLQRVKRELFPVRDSDTAPLYLIILHCALDLNLSLSLLFGSPVIYVFIQKEIKTINKKCRKKTFKHVVISISRSAFIASTLMNKKVRLGGREFFSIFKTKGMN